MAIVQISRITQRKGLSENLPQLAGAEFGWATNARKLYIGNGTLADGAPVIGNTEVLTEFSDILSLAGSYTYKDTAVGYEVQTGPTLNQPITRTIQAKLDDFASVRDFGATGDGVTDDTLAINRALYQLYCREVNSAVRRSLFFPAGTYRITETIVIPTYAKLYGEGPYSSIIQLDVSGDYSTLNSYVARYGDSLQQIGAQIGSNGATPPQYITIQDMSFQTAQATDIFLVDQAKSCTFSNVVFQGPLTEALLSNSLTRDDIACIRYNSSGALICEQINFDNCGFSGTTWAVNTDEQIKGSSISNSKFNTLYQGGYLGGISPINGGATGFTFMHNIFDTIYAEGLYFDTVSHNASGYNVFYDVGNHFSGTTSPFTPVITFTDDDNLSIGDMFERSNTYDAIEPRVNLSNTASIRINSSGAEFGTYTIQTGQEQELLNNATNVLLARFDTGLIKAATLDYTFVRDTRIRTGSITVVSADPADVLVTLSYSDNYTENADIGILVTAVEAGEYVNIRYSSTNTGVTGQIYHSLKFLA